MFTSPPISATPTLPAEGRGVIIALCALGLGGGEMKRVEGGGASGHCNHDCPYHEALL